MSSSCDNDCKRPVAFPKPIANRPGLGTIDYRIGSYADLRAHMLARIDAAPELADWTHRGTDDPGIALVEAAAEVGDILSFYQDLYANEAYLGTAKWRDSVAPLVRLLGYRLAPGLGGRGRFAFTAKGERPVLLPAGLGVKAQLDGTDPPAVFETTQALTAYPALSAFRLYRPRRAPEIRYGATVFTLVPDADPPPALKAGDRLMVGVARDGGQSFDHLQVLVVDTVEQAFGDTVLTMKGALTSLKKPVFSLAVSAFFGAPALSVAASFSPSFSLAPTTTSLFASAFTSLQVFAPSLDLSFALLGAGLGVPTLASTPRLQAWKLGGTHRHFGHSAPATVVVVDPKGRATTEAMTYVRRLDGSTYAPAVPALSAAQLPLDGEVRSMVAGTRVLVEANLSPSSSGGAGRKRLLARRIAQLDRQSLAWGPLSGASTVLSLDDNLAISEGASTLAHADIRGIGIHEVQGEPFQLRAQFVPTLATRGTELHFHGTTEQAAALAKRALLFAGPDGRVRAVSALSVEGGGVDADQPQFHRVRLDQEVDYAEFGHVDPPVTVHGNLVEVTQGKTEAQATLGDGDARAVFQTFALPKPPLTYLLDPTRAPPQVPQLQVWVDGVAWTAVDSLFGRGPGERVYIVREDDAGKSWVQFGDGKSGARLRSGRGNVVAVWRSGSGAHGPLKADAKPSIDKKLPGLDAALLLEPVTGGAMPESADGARIAAPGTMQSLGRVVSLADHEAEALAIPGVLKARAAWTLVDGSPLVRVTLLTASAATADAAAAADALRAAVRSRGAARCPLLVVQGARTPVALRLVVGIDPLRRADDLRPLILEALGATGEEGNGVDASCGLFSWQRRRFGEGVHGSQVVAAVQQVTGVVWVRLVWLSSGSGFAVAHVPATQRSVNCAGDRVLALDSAALQLQLTADKEGALS